MQAVPPLPGLPAILRVTIHTVAVDGKTELTSQLVVYPPFPDHIFTQGRQ